MAPYYCSNSAISANHPLEFLSRIHFYAALPVQLGTTTRENRLYNSQRAVRSMTASRMVLFVAVSRSATGRYLLVPFMSAWDCFTRFDGFR
jgi:hypothetical protein